jgi:hypothetical protein
VVVTGATAGHLKGPKVSHRPAVGDGRAASDTPPVLAPRCEELECDVVGVSK